MKYLKIYNKVDIKPFLNKRTGETKFGEKVNYLNPDIHFDEALQQCNSKYVLFGIKESIGVKANMGIQGTETAWESCLKSLLNTQNNSYNKGKRLLVLGHLDFNELMLEASNLSTSKADELSKLYDFVTLIDSCVSNLIFSIVSSGKIPIIVGGGHNNAYGNIKGTSLALNNKINVINFDAHTDFRALEGRHSGNGFSYAFQEGFLNKYFMFGLHENYTSKRVFKTIKSLESEIKFNTFEELIIRQELSFKSEIKRALTFFNNRKFGIEIDLDAIQGVSSSALTPSGFNANQCRQFIHELAKTKKALYLHLCEGAPDLELGNQNQTGKLLSYLITDFIKA